MHHRGGPGNARLASRLQIADGMRKPMLLLAMAMTTTVGLAGCYAGPCGGCRAYESCDPVTTTCVLNAGTKFDLIADDGDVPGDNWDPLFGPPDPYVCVSVGGAPETCSSQQSDDSSPKWNQQLAGGLSGDELLAAPMAVSYEDSDVDSPDLICSGSVTVTPQFLHDGSFRFNCSNGAWARFSLQNTDPGTPSVGTR